MDNQIKTIALLGGLSFLLITIGGAIGPLVMYGAIALALVMNVGAYFFSDQIVLRMNGAEVVEKHQAPQVYQMVEDLAKKAQLPMPKVAIIDDPTPNAFATGRDPQHGVVAVTTGILQQLTERQLRGVIAHELAHIKNRDILIQSIAAVVASAISSISQLLMFFPMLAQSDDEEGGMNPFAALLFAIIAPIAATLIQFGISRAREYRADEVGAQICGDPNALADALEQLERGVSYAESTAAPATASMYIVNPLTGGSMASWFSTHPATEERVRRLRAMSR